MMKKRLGPIIVSIAIVVIFLVLGLISKGNNIAILNPKGIIAHQERDLIFFTVGLGLLVIIPVFVMLFGFMWKYRASNTKAPYTPDVDGNRKIEAIWWGIPVAIITILSVVTYVSTHQLDPYRPLASNKTPLQVQVISLQWRWLFIYPEQGVAAINELRMPVDRPVEFSISADSPMSAFWIPNLGSQTYAMNGMTSKLHLQADTIGSYRGSNSNISGKGYAKMHFDAVVTSEADFDSWVLKTRQANNSLSWKSYQNLAKQSEDESVRYYSLQDKDLYDRIESKYMGHGGKMMSGSRDSMMNHDEGQAH